MIQEMQMDDIAVIDLDPVAIRLITLWEEISWLRAHKLSLEDIDMACKKVIDGRIRPGGRFDAEEFRCIVKALNDSILMPEVKD
jgi:hypothetical protein